jgi:hypothetical protein
VVSGHELKDAAKSGDIVSLLGYLTNQKIPSSSPIHAFASVGIGNIKLPTAAQLWRGEACSFFGDCTKVNIAPLLNNQERELLDPYRQVCRDGVCLSQISWRDPSEVQVFERITDHLLNDAINIEYASAIIEAGAERARKLKPPVEPDIYNSIIWYTRSVHTAEEINQLSSDGIVTDPTGHAVYLRDHVYPTIFEIFRTLKTHG